MIKVAEVVTDSSQTGAPLQVYYLLQGLQNSHFKLYLVCPAGWLSSEAGKLKSVEVITYPDNLGRNDQIEAIRKIYEQIHPDIIHCHGVRATLVGRFAATKTKAKVIFTEHLWTLDFHLPNIVRQQLQILTMRHLSQKAIKVVAVSRAVKDFLIKRRIVPERKVVIIPGAVAHHNVLPLPKTQTVGTLGTLTYVKGVDTLLQAVALAKKDLPNLRCLIAGDGPDRNNLEKLAAQLGIEKNVDFIGAQNGSEDFLKRIDCYVQASRSESFGMAVVEAMSAGRPVIVNKAGALPETVSSAGLVFAKNNAEDLAKNIVKLFSDQKLYEQLANDAPKVAGRYTAENMAREYKKLYDQVTYA